MKQDLVAVAMSGGVDSSVAAALLIEKGYSVVGLTMQLLPPGQGAGPGSRGCCTADDAADARGVADSLGIPHYLLNMRDVFRRHVIQDFISAYQEGLTPNPCLACNRYVKFDHLLHRARQIGARYLATGHYARIVPGEEGRMNLLRARFPGKDQSYALYAMTQPQLHRTLFPLGDLEKSQVRRLASGLGLPVAEKPESQEICFVEGDYRHYLTGTGRVPERPGPIVDRMGNVLGQHQGIAMYTVGQRRGLGLPGGAPMYVVRIDSQDNTLVVGSREDLLAPGLVASDINWIVSPPSGPISALVRVRYGSPRHPARLHPEDNNRIRVEFDRPVSAIAPGQAAVFYSGDLVLGGGTIDEARLPNGGLE